MSGTVAGGKKAAATNYEKYGRNFYREIGRRGGVKRSHRGIHGQPRASEESWSEGRKNIAARQGETIVD